MPLTAVLAAEAGGPPAFLGPTAALVIASAVIGYLCVRVRVVPIVGFLLAGVLIGPAQLGIVQRQETVEGAAEIGVILLLFTIGVEFSLDRLNRIRGWILLGGGLQVGLTAGLVLGVLAALGVGWRESLFTGFLVALSSTAIVLKLLGDAGETSSRRGQLALAVLVFQDLAVVLMVLLVPVLGSDAAGSRGPAGLPVALLTAGGIVGVVLVLARRVMPPLLERVARTCSQEVFLLSVVAICLGTAYLTALAGVSVSLGAFLAGLVVSESRQSSQVLGEILPLQIIFSAVFFVSVGMLLDVGFVLDNLGLVLLGVLAVVVVKAVTAAVSVAALGVGAGTAVGTGLLLAQVGEFSFVLESAGRDAGLSPAGLGAAGAQAFVAATVLLMVTTPALGTLGRTVETRLARRARTRTATAADPGPQQPAEGPRDHVLVSGWGDAARAVAVELRDRGVPVTVVTLSPDGAAEAEREGHHVVTGDSTRRNVLERAGVRHARLVVVADDGAEEAARIVGVVRQLGDAPVVVRPLGEADVEALAAAGADRVVDAYRASHRVLADSVLAELFGSDGGVAAGAGHAGRTRVDTTRVVDYAVPSPPPFPHTEAVRPVLPSAPGCEPCLRTGSDWVHLRVCLGCGHVGCCDSSAGRHARAHFQATGHCYIASAEPGETWAFCFLDDVLVPRPVPRPTSARGQPGRA